MVPEVVVTGASGFIGGAFLKQARREKFSAIGLTRGRLQGLVSVASYADIPARNGAVLVHLAQGRDVSSAFHDAEIELCRFLTSRKWRHIVYASSAVVYGDGKEYPRRTDEPVKADSDYARVKLACEEIVGSVGGTCLRFANLYGPGMAANTVISEILRQIPGSGPLLLRDVSPIRDFLWIDDAARCLTAVCSLTPGGVLNVGSGRGTSVGDIARLALELAGEISRPVIGRTTANSISSLALDISRARSVLDWYPKIDLRAGLSVLLHGK